MQNNSINAKVASATKWSGVTEIAAKLVAPITTMVLARLLTPEAFGVLVTAQMVISFAEIFTDAGFQKYLIQHEFRDSDDKNRSTAVAFWSNLIMSIFIWLSICLFAKPIATIVGCEGNGAVIAISCVCVPLAAFSSIQMALFKRDLDFKTLFWVRIFGILIPFFITIPIAIISRSYWALIIGMISQHAFNAVILTIKSPWKPKWFYSFKLFKEMFSFTMWSMIEAVSVWLTSYFDLFIVGSMLNQHYLGLYRTSMSTVAQITTLITSATTPVLFSSLSRLQTNRKDFDTIFFKFQKLVGMLIIPLGVGIYLFSDLITEILLGNQWSEASHFIGLWGLTSAFTIVLAHYSSEVYRSMGRPKLSVLAQWLHIAALWPIVLIFVHKGFSALCTARALVRLELILVQLIIMGVAIKMNIKKMFTNILPSVISSSAMFMVLLLPKTQNIWIQFAYIFLCIIVYVCFILIFPEERTIFKSLPSIIRRK